MSDQLLLIIGIVVFSLLFVAIVLTFMEFRQLSRRDSLQPDAVQGNEKKP